jgi:hypothetical protein
LEYLRLYRFSPALVAGHLDDLAAAVEMLRSFAPLLKRIKAGRPRGILGKRAIGQAPHPRLKTADRRSERIAACASAQHGNNALAELKLRETISHTSDQP